MTWIPVVCFAGCVLMFFASLVVYADTLKARDDARQERAATEERIVEHRRRSIRRIS